MHMMEGRRVLRLITAGVVAGAGWFATSAADHIGRAGVPAAGGADSAARMTTLGCNSCKEEFGGGESKWTCDSSGGGYVHCTATGTGCSEYEACPPEELGAKEPITLQGIR